MSGKTFAKGMREGRDVSTQQKTMHRECTVQKSIVFHHNSKPSLFLSDENEFPSLNESSGIVSSNSFSSGKTLKYSDKLKSSSSSKNETSGSEYFSFKNNSITNVYEQHGNKNVNANDQNSWSHSKNKLKTAVQNIHQGEPVKTQYKNLKRVDISSSQNIPKKQHNELLIEKNSFPERLISEKNEQTTEKHLASTSKTPRRLSRNKASGSASNTNPTISQSHSERVSTVGNKVERGDNEDIQSKAKKKKRKSKVKRQVAMQSGKITVLTPEVHLKILNQTSAFKQTSRIVLTDINDEEEYPELGKTVLATNQKDNLIKKEISLTPTKDNIEMPSNAVSGEKNVINEPPICDIISETPVTEKKGKNDTKTTVHSKDPIALSFYDMLLINNSKPKVKEIKEGANASTTVELTKIKMKKNSCQPHNLLDSSSPMVKRGKEREKPKQKKPSMLKKIILLDRKARKEHFLLLKNNELVEEVVTNEHDNEIVEEKDVPDENYESSCQLNLFLEDDGFSSSGDEKNLQDELPIMEQINYSETLEQSSNDSSATDTLCEDVIPENNLDVSKLSLSVDEIFNYDKDSQVKPETVTATAPVSLLDFSFTNSMLSGLTNSGNKSESHDREKAAKILLHTRNFRQYCNHLISKDIDDAVFALLDDLARFQDRLHQKDPVKARMKKRMIYGVKEVKKHIKLKKLKCIIIAVDIENVESQGGLNDVLNDIKVLAADHHIPCVFALSRKVLGRVCRKPVPVSCVGVFNFEGSEANFKKMVELQTQSKTDYNELFDKLFLKLTEEETLSLLKAKTEAPETLHSIRVDILNDFFMQSKNNDADLNLSGYKA